MKFNVFLPFGFSVVALVLYAWFLSQPQLIWSLVLVLTLLSLFNAWSFSRQAKNYTQWWQFSLLPILANIITPGYLIILSSQSIAYLIIGVLTIFNYIYWRYLYFYFNNPNRYQAFSLEYLSFYIDFVLVFFLASAIFGLRSFLDLDFWISLLVIASSLALVIFQFGWINKYQAKVSRIYLWTAWLLLVELYLALLYLPLNHNALGFVWSVSYYLLMVIINDRLKDKLNHTRIKAYLSIGGLIILLVLLSAKWL